MLVMAVANIYLRTEGVEAVLDALQRAGIGGVMLTTYYEELMAPGHGVRFPSLMASLERKLGGLDEMHVIIHSAFEPTPSYYGPSKIRPLPTSPDPDLRRDLLGDTIAAARRRGLRVMIADAPLAVPPRPEAGNLDPYGYPWPAVGYEECKAVRADGQRITGVEAKGCPNNPDVRHHGLGRIRDILAHFPDLDALGLDHVEFPTYTVEDNFACFCDHCRSRAQRLGYPWERMRQDSMAFLSRLHQLTNNDLRAVVRGQGLLAALDLLVRYPGVLDLVRFKLDSIDAFLCDVRAVTREMGAGHVKLALTGFTPAFALVASRDYRRLPERCDVLIPKFYMEHWVRILGWWVDRLTGWNPSLDPSLCLLAIYRVLGFDGLRMPQAREALDLRSGLAVPVELIDMEAPKMLDMVGTRAAVFPVIHMAGTTETLTCKLEALRRHRMGALLWGYFFATDEKLDAIRRFQEEGAGGNLGGASRW